MSIKEVSAEQVLKIDQQVQQFAQHIQKYKKLFLADDGRIDSDEQQQLDALQVRMNQINQRLTELKGEDETNLSTTENDYIELKGSAFDRSNMIDDPIKTIKGTH